jgi:hypothetical protein
LPLPRPPVVVAVLPLSVLVPSTVLAPPAPLAFVPVPVPVPVPVLVVTVTVPPSVPVVTVLADVVLVTLELLVTFDVLVTVVPPPVVPVVTPPLAVVPLAVVLSPVVVVGPPSTLLSSLLTVSLVLEQAAKERNRQVRLERESRRVGWKRIKEPSGNAATTIVTAGIVAMPCFKNAPANRELLQPSQ